MRRASQLLRLPVQYKARQAEATFRTRPVRPSSLLISLSECSKTRAFSRSTILQDDKDEHAAKAKELNEKAQKDKEKTVRHDGQLDDKIGQAKELQARTPWHREGADKPPVRRLRSAGAMTKGTPF